MANGHGKTRLLGDAASAVIDENIGRPLVRGDMVAAVAGAMEGQAEDWLLGPSTDEEFDAAAWFYLDVVDQRTWARWYRDTHCAERTAW